ncbi:MAG: OmpP1/FadL family transporter [Planctomycetota bacterium]
MSRDTERTKGDGVLPRWLLPLALHSVILAVPAAGSGLESPGIGPRGRAMGYAMVAIADDWTAIHYNPAGLVQITGQHFGIEYGLLTGHMASTKSLRNLNVGANPLRGDFVDLIGDEPPSFNEKRVVGEVTGGTLGYVYGSRRLALGVGLYSSGSASSWEDMIGVVGGDVITANISFVNASLDVPIVLACQISDDLSLGLCLGLHSSELTIDNHKSRSGAMPYVMAITQDTEGLDVSADLGILWEASDRFAFGAVMRFPYTREPSGWTQAEITPLSVRSDTEVEIHYPARFALGCSFRPSDQDLLGFSMTWHDWSDYSQRTEYAPQVPGVLENSSANPSNWHDATALNLGYERKYGGNKAFRCGIARDGAPEPREARTLVGGVVVDTWKFALGSAVSWGKITLDVGYMYSYGPEVDGYVPGATYSSHMHEVSVGVQARF